MGLHCMPQVVARVLREYSRVSPALEIELRDLPKGNLNADTLYIMTTKDRKKDLRALIESWSPDVCIATQADRFDDELSAHTRQVADMMGLSELPKDVVVFQVWWD